MKRIPQHYVYIFRNHRNFLEDDIDNEKYDSLSEKTNNIIFDLYKLYSDKNIEVTKIEYVINDSLQGTQGVAVFMIVITYEVDVSDDELNNHEIKYVGKDVSYK